MAPKSLTRSEHKPIDPLAIRLWPLGVDQTQEGCSYWLEMGSHAILLDCGLHDPQPLRDLPRPPDLVVCSHAHPDHLRALPWFHRFYPDVPIYSTRITYRFASGLWPLQHQHTQDPSRSHEDPPPTDSPPTRRKGEDPFELGSRSREFPPLRCLPYNRAAVVGDDLTLSFFQAGHLPGAAVAVLQDARVSPPLVCVYTGDFSLASTRFSEGLDLMSLRHWQPDVLLIEATLGVDRYPSRRQLESRLVERLATTLEEGRIILVPVPAVGLGQELLFLLKTHHRFTRSGSEFTLWIDPAVARGCDLYQEHLAEFPQSVQNFTQHQALFWEDRVYPHVRPLPHHHQDLVEILGQPGIILCHAEGSTQDWIPLWYALETRLAALTTDHDRDESETEAATLPLQLLHFQEITMSPPLSAWPRWLRDQIEIERCFWHSHSDSSNVVQVIHTLRPQHVVLTHGRRERLIPLADLPELCNRYHIHSPVSGRQLDLVRSPIHPAGAEEFAEPDQVEQRYEGEVEELKQTDRSRRSVTEAIQVLLPAELSDDPRWQDWADTGILEARWQGNELVLRGLSAKELIKPVPDGVEPGAPKLIRLHQPVRDPLWPDQVPPHQG